MAYTVLNKSLQVKGKLTLNNGQGGTTFFADTITQQLATDNSSDPANSTAMAFNEYDKQGNAKQWGHSITISVEATDLGASITTNDYLMYFDDVNNHYYLMKVITAETDRNSGFVTISGINTAIYELGKQIVNDETTFKQANLQAVVNGLYKNAPFSVIIQDDLATVIDYTVSANTSLQAVLQDLQTKYNVDVDSWIELDESGNISDRIIYLGHIGRDNGELIRYGGAKGFENINAQELSDTIYTKLYVTGLTDDKNPTKGHIGSVNNGMEFITDDNANAKQYAIGASQQQPVYLEGSITNTLLSEPQALLTWAKAQMGIFNHPRFNYTVTPLHDQIVGIGDTIAVQDFHIKPEILVTSKVIQKSTSFASPETNTFVLGEFSSIFTENANKGAGVIQLIKKDVTVVQEAADNARASAEAAHEQAVQAQQAAIHAQTTADGKTTTYTVDSVQDLPDNAIEGDIGWVKLSDGTHMYSYTDGKWVEKINPSMGADINKKVSDAVTQAKTYTTTAIEQNNASQQEVMNDIAKSQADLAIKDGDFNNKAQAMADKALSDAKANTATVAQETLDTANQNLAAAKSDLTDGLQKEVSDRTSAVSALDTKAQGYVDTAKTDILQTVNKEVTDRQNAVSALDTKATNAVNQAKSDINDTINSLSVGGRNLLLNSKTLEWGVSNNSAVTSTKVSYDGTTNMWHITAPKGGSGNAGIYFYQSNDIVSNVITKGQQWAFSFDIKGTGDHSQFGIEGSTSFNKYTGSVSSDWTRVSSTGTANGTKNAIIIYFNGIDVALDVYIKLPKLEIGAIPTDWTPAPEDVVLDYTTKDNQIKETISQYQTNNDGKVSKAQTDATTALGQVATKVSQTDYDTKTGDLSTKYTQVKQTADSQATDIVDIKKTATSQASKINSISSDVDGTKQSISDIETTQDSQSDKINQITSDVNGTKQSITDIQTKDGKQDTRMGTIETSVSGVKSDFSSYKTTNDGVVKTAQTTAQTAVDGLKNKVSQTDYNTKTGQLQTDLTTTTQTANQAKTDIVSIKQKDGDQDSRMTQIESGASGVKTTVSDLSTVQGKQSGYISELQQRADGFDATVTKVNNLSVGGRNYILNSKTLSWGVGTNTATTSTKVSYDSATNMWHITSPKGGSGNAGIYFSQTDNVSNIITNGQQWAFSFDIKGTGVYSQFGIEWSSPFNKPSGNVPTDWTRVSSTGTAAGTGTKSIIIYFNSVDVALDVYIKLPKLESGNKATDWTPAPEDLSNATAKAQLTADNAALAISDYKTNADGRISQAQADITATAKQVATKVSQTDYDKKTGDLTTAVSKAQTTADGVVTTVGNYQTSNDERVKAAESTIEQHSKDITARVTKTDYDDKTGELSGSISTLKQRADGFDATVTKVDNLAVGGRNLLLGTEQFTGDLSPRWEWVNTWDADPYNGHKTVQTGSAWGGPKYVINDLFNRKVVEPNTDYTLSVKIKNTSNDPIDIYFYAPAIGILDRHIIKLPPNSGWTTISTTFQFSDIDPNIGHGTMRFEPSSGIPSGQGTIIQTEMKFERGNITTDWTPAPEDIETALAQVKITADSVSSIVSNPTTGLSTRVQTAEGTLSTVKGTDIPALQNATFWQPYSSLNFNDYTKQGSIFFNTTAAKTNGPTTSNAWTYLIVEQGTSDTSRIKQTAWYDGIAGVKITYVRTLNSGTWSPWYANDNDSVTTISQTNSDIRQEISDRKTGDNNTLQSSKDFTQSSITSYDKGMQTQFTQTASGILAKVGATNLFPNSDFDTDYGYRKKDGNTVLSLATKNNIDGAYNGTVSVNSTAATYQGYWTNNIQVQGGQKYSASVKVHYTNGGISNGKALLDLWFIDSTGARISSASMSTSQVSSPYWVQLVSEGFTAPTNAVYLQMSLLVNDAGTGQVATFTQPMLTATEKLQGYTPNDGISATLALFKDNWSIGINDNIGNITSGIVGNALQMSLISKNVTIDSPNTQITGTAWIKSAMIANGAIGNAQIGNAVIDSSKIANLDVSKLTGDTITGFNITANKQITIASGGSLQSDVVNMDKTSISILAQNVSVHRVSPEGYTVGALGTFQLKSNFGAILSDGVISVTKPNETKPYRIGTFHSGYGTNNMYLQAVDYDDGSLNEYVDLSSAQLNMINTDKSQKVINSMSVTAGGIATTGSITTSNQVWAGNIGINGFHSFISQDNQDFWLGAGNGGSVGMVGKSWKNSSLKSLKENFINVDPEYALNELLKTDIRSYNFRGDKVTDNYVSPIIDDVEGKLYIPKDFLDSTGKSVKTYSIDGYLIQAIKALQEQITELKQG